MVFILKRLLGEMLLQLRDSKSEYYSNQWNFPGGKCEAGESSINTAIREVKEEYGIDIKKEHCSSLMVYNLPHRPYSAEVFVCEVDENQQVPKLQEGAAMQWMKLDQVKKIKLGFGQEVIIPKLETFLRTKK